MLYNIKVAMITLMIEFDIFTFNYRKYVPHFGYSKSITFGILNLHNLNCYEGPVIRSWGEGSNKDGTQLFQIFGLPL